MKASIQMHPKLVMAVMEPEHFKMLLTGSFSKNGMTKAEQEEHRLYAEYVKNPKGDLSDWTRAAGIRIVLRDASEIKIKRPVKEDSTQYGG